MIKITQELAEDEKIDSNHMAWLASVDFHRSAIYDYHMVLWSLSNISIRIDDRDIPILAKNFNGSYPDWFIKATEKFVKRRLKDCGNLHLTKHAKELLDCIKGMDDLKSKVNSILVKGELERA